jgi:nitroreductase
MPTELHTKHNREELLSPTDGMQTIVAAAVLAPSAHNTQPWRFTVETDTIDFYVDWQRHLNISDPTGRQLYISLGCALANAIVAAHHRGYQAAVTYFPAGESKEAPAARLVLKTQPELAVPSAQHMFRAIEQRRTDRSLYDGKPLSLIEEQQLNAQENVLLITDRAAMETLALLTEEATYATLSRKDFKAELSRWVRHSWTKQPDGMPGYAMGMPAPLSLIASVMVRLAPIHKQEGPKARQEMNSASAIAVVVSDHDTPADWLAAGQALENMWLKVTAVGLAAAPLVAAVEAGESTRARLQAAVHTDKLPQSILRIGHSRRGALRPTPRRSVSDCLT